ncbi:GNAT family N-acetyltransferase [Streptomyces sp. NPDC058301]|uniref:GNAT family N-acetyltransferase n=1 Tax=Streptomyces sp. NPDC058301 TaxID=3346436 RepID=UPI0036E227FE
MRRIGPGGLEIGYWIHPAWTGQGLATMAAAALLREAFRLPGVELVEIHQDEANKASGAVPRRLGFTEIGRQPRSEEPTAPGEVGVEVIWRLLRGSVDRDGQQLDLMHPVR